MQLYNTLTRKVENFKPIDDPKVGMYTCGPTVYDYMHIGNLRTFVLSDILHRVFTYNSYKVTAVENITDIDDKIIKRAKERNITIEQLAAEYTNYFLEDIATLNITLKNVQAPRATEHIGGMIKYIEVLIGKGLAYVEKDGSVYFDISKFPDYGKLSGLEKRELKTGTRSLSDEYTKDDVQDFALWKAVESTEVGWSSPWVKGRPGWHIECSVMSQKHLGDTFDIHVGGIDLIFPHHENEIAQSEGKTGKPFVNYFVHGAHMLVDGKKMSKSLSNFYTLADVVKKGFDPLSLRYLYLQIHYRSEMNFTWEALEGAQNTLNKLRHETVSWGKSRIGCAEFEERFLEAINDDLNMPKALGIVWDLVKSDNPPEAKAESLLKFDEVLGLNLHLEPGIEFEKKIPDKVLALVKDREALRRQKRFHLADQLRNKIKKTGFDVEDTKKGYKIVKL